MGLYNVRTALLAFVLLPFLAVAILVGWYSLVNLESKARAGMEKDIELIARAIRLPLSYALEHHDHNMLIRTLSSTREIGRVYGVYVYDRNGQRIAGSGARKALVQNRKAAEIASIGNEQAEFDDAEGESVFSYFVPLTNMSGQINGLLQVSRRGTDFSSDVAEFRRNAIVLMLVSSLLLIFAVYIGYHFALGRHLHSMQNGMRRIASGDFGLRFTPRGPAEVGFLARGVNTMLDGIEAADRELAVQRENEYNLKARLQQSEKMAAIGRLAAGVAHELGTPLSVADGKAQRALRTTVDEPTRETLGDIRQQLARMTNIIRQLMNFARPTAPERRQLNVADTVQMAMAQIEEERAACEVNIQVLAGDSVHVYGNKLRIEQALINLLRNAVQATAPGGCVQVHWSLIEEGEMLELIVEDDGPGIPPDLEPRLFEPFMTSKVIGEGVGLGLAVVAAVANEHDGQVSVSRSQMGGALFRLVLPLELAKVTNETS